jgi:hypothetical protein
MKSPASWRKEKNDGIHNCSLSRAMRKLSTCRSLNSSIQINLIESFSEHLEPFWMTSSSFSGQSVSIKIPHCYLDYTLENTENNIYCRFFDTHQPNAQIFRWLCPHVFDQLLERGARSEQKTAETRGG